MKQGLVQVYTGDGKGKTTAALGLSLRAIGQGMKVCFFQFGKGKKAFSGELKAAEPLAPALEIRRFPHQSYLRGTVGREKKEKMREATRCALQEVGEVIRSKAFDVVLLDEINVMIPKGIPGGRSRVWRIANAALEAGSEDRS